MANAISPYTPSFGVDYVGNQVIIASDRVMLHSKTDSIFLFGKESVSLSSVKTVNIDAVKGVILESPKIQLGSHTAVEKVIFGNTHFIKLTQFLNEITDAAIQLQSVSAGKTQDNSPLGVAMTKLAIFAKQLDKACSSLKTSLPASLSNTTFTT